MKQGWSNTCVYIGIPQGVQTMWNPKPHICVHAWWTTMVSNICWWSTCTYKVCSAFNKHVGPNRLFNMKSCDHNVMLRHRLHVGIGNLLHLGPKRTIIYLVKTFHKLFTKVLNPNDIQNLRTYLVKTLLEIWWPPTFFGLQTHLIIHLVNEL
jgi:hypothetical protein